MTITMHKWPDGWYRSQQPPRQQPSFMGMDFSSRPSVTVRVQFDPATGKHKIISFGVR